MVEVKVQSLGIDQDSKTPVVILQELAGERLLPIWIGPAEASAIATELAGMKTARPLTHDLAASLIRGLGGALSRVLITRVQDNTYFAELVIKRGAEHFSIDARPSDSIAIALRLAAPVFTTDELLTNTALHLPTGEGQDAGTPLGPGDAGGLSAEQLQEYLKRLNPEDLGRFNP